MATNILTFAYTREIKHLLGSMAYCKIHRDERLEANLHAFWTSNFKFGISTDGGGSQWTSEPNRVLDGKIL